MLSMEEKGGCHWRKGRKTKILQDFKSQVWVSVSIMTAGRTRKELTLMCKLFSRLGLQRYRARESHPWRHRHAIKDRQLCGEQIWKPASFEGNLSSTAQAKSYSKATREDMKYTAVMFLRCT